MRRFLAQALDRGVWSAVVALAATPESIELEEAAGLAGTSTRFDYASLTKPFTATLALTLDADGTLLLAARIGDLWPEAHRDLARRPLSDLLRHRS
ncbi:MAG TPA: serine hydrolase, partial [Thermoanaerobaculia bacterium]|nr:serine hydrolase [Thermoanaerobaculia bacterium]